MKIDERITPACAGSTEKDAEEATMRWDHPRLRGEYKIPPFFNFSKEGSPPLARGVQRQSACCLLDAGITPACAGSTWDSVLHVENC